MRKQNNSKKNAFSLRQGPETKTLPIRAHQHDSSFIYLAVPFSGRWPSGAPGPGMGEVEYACMMLANVAGTGGDW